MELELLEGSGCGVVGNTLDYQSRDRKIDRPRMRLKTEVPSSPRTIRKSDYSPSPTPIPLRLSASCMKKTSHPSIQQSH